MPSDKRQTSISYLQNALADGARPFHYRSGVRSLLGAPESEEGHMAFSPTLPAVGFRYVNHPLLNEPPRIRRPGNETERFVLNSEREVETEDSLASPWERIQCCEPFEETRPENPAPSGRNKNRQISQKGNSIGETVPRHHAVPEPKQNNASGVQEETLEKPSVIMEEPAGETSGVSAKSSSGPSLPMKARNTRPSSLEDRNRQEVSPTNSREHVMKRPLFEAQEDTSAIDLPSASVSAAEKSQRARGVQEERAATPSPDSMESLLADDTAKAVRGKAGTSEKDEFSKTVASPTLALEEKCAARLNRTPGTPPSQSRYVSTNTLSGANRNAAERIEQLQHAVYQLTARVSSRQAKVNQEAQHETPAQAQPPPVKPVVIIKQLSSQTSRPCAFWERSYLSRFHLKTLR